MCDQGHQSSLHIPVQTASTFNIHEKDLNYFRARRKQNGACICHCFKRVVLAPKFWGIRLSGKF